MTPDVGAPANASAPRPRSNRSLGGFVRVLEHFWPHLRDQKPLLAGAAVALLAETLLRLAEPWPLKLVFDRVLLPRPGRTHLLGLLPAHFDGPALIPFAALALVAITALRALAGYLSTIGLARVGNRALARVRGLLYQKLQYLSLSFHSQARTGDLVVRVVNDVGMLQDVAVTALLPLAGRALLVAGIAVVALYMDWQLTLFAMLPLPLLWLRSSRLTRQIRDAARQSRKREGAMAATAAESLAAIRVVQALSIEGSFADTFHRDNEKNLRQDLRGKRLAAGLERSVDVFLALSTALVLWIGALRVVEGRLSAGDLLVLLTYLKNAFRPVQDFAKYAGRLGKAAAAGERVLELLDVIPDVHDLPGARPAPRFAGAVRFEKVDFAYAGGGPVLRHLDLEVAAGETVAIVGPSGAGKTTLLSLLLRLYDPVSGRVFIDGVELGDYTLTSLRGQIATVLQENLLFAMSVADNIRHLVPGASVAEVEAAARLANAHEFIAAMPGGYDSVVGERGVTLSQGQRQRIAIARAAIADRPILLLDEPTTGLDERNQAEVIDALERLRHGRTTFLVTHSHHQAMRADRILYLEDGRIVEQGRPEELAASRGPYAALFRLDGAPHPHGPSHAVGR